MKKLVLILISLSSFNLLAETYNCRLVGGMPSTLLLTKINIQSNQNESIVKFSSNKGEMKFDKVECQEEQMPERVLSCEHDKFVIIIDLEEDKPKAVVNPFVYEGKEHGPYFYLCSGH